MRYRGKGVDCGRVSDLLDQGFGVIVGPAGHSVFLPATVAAWPSLRRAYVELVGDLYGRPVVVVTPRAAR